MVPRIGKLTLAFALMVTGGVLATLAWGRLMLWMGGTCTVACDPATGALLGAVGGGIAFALDVGGLRTALVGAREEDAADVD
ncbi:MAG: hypothetical protein DIU72_003420 [Pseudomonadota bacterium]|nr:MAG: hypothetical protein DIU72_08520 [Pseudomonadota bacterium]